MDEEERGRGAGCAGAELVTRENWDALLAALSHGGPVTLSPEEAVAVHRELELLGGSGFLTIDPPKPHPLERA